MQAAFTGLLGLARGAIAAASAAPPRRFRSYEDAACQLACWLGS